MSNEIKWSKQGSDHIMSAGTHGFRIVRTGIHPTMPYEVFYSKVGSESGIPVVVALAATISNAKAQAEEHPRGIVQAQEDSILKAVFGK